MTKQAKEAKPYNPSRTEVFKTVVIAVMIAGVLAFMAGVRYANGQHNATERAVQAATASVTVKK